MSRELEEIIKEIDEKLTSSKPVPTELVLKSILASIACLANRLANVEAKVKTLETKNED